MKLNTSKMAVMFNSDELRALELASAADKTLLPAIAKYLQVTLDKVNVPSKEVDFDSPSWANQRAFRDGRVTELVALIDLIKE